MKKETKHYKLSIKLIPQTQLSKTIVCLHQIKTVYKLNAATKKANGLQLSAKQQNLKSQTKMKYKFLRKFHKAKLINFKKEKVLYHTDQH